MVERRTERATDVQRKRSSKTEKDDEGREQDVKLAIEYNEENVPS